MFVRHHKGRGAVSDHEGRIDVASEPDKGTEFFVSFPVQREEG